MDWSEARQEAWVKFVKKRRDLRKVAVPDHIVDAYLSGDAANDVETRMRQVPTEWQLDVLSMELGFVLDVNA